MRCALVVEMGVLGLGTRLGLPYERDIRNLCKATAIDRAGFELCPCWRDGHLDVRSRLLFTWSAVGW